MMFNETEIVWYDGDECQIKFSCMPATTEMFPCPNFPEDLNKNIVKQPFLNLKRLDVTLIDYNKCKTYKFVIPKDYTWDGASVPILFWRIIGSKTDPRFQIPSLIHDVLCENHKYVDNDRYFADRVFERLLYVAGVPAFKRWMMFHSVDNFQKFCKWD